MTIIDKGLLLRRAAMRAHVSEADERKSELQTIVDDMVRALGKLKDIGGERDFLDDTLCNLHRVACDIDDKHNKTIDSAGLHYAWVDLTELDALLAMVRR